MFPVGRAAGRFRLTQAEPIAGKAKRQSQKPFHGLNYNPFLAQESLWFFGPPSLSGKLVLAPGTRIQLQGNKPAGSVSEPLFCGFALKTFRFDSVFQFSSCFNPPKNSRPTSLSENGTARGQLGQKRARGRQGNFSHRAFKGLGGIIGGPGQDRNRLPF